MTNQYILCSGCSHTDSSLTYIDQADFWINQVGQSLNLEIKNLAMGGACASYVSQSIQHWLATSPAPKLVVAQWPNPYRSQDESQDGIPRFSNVNCQSSAFSERLKTDPKSFWHEWKQSIVDLNHACQVPLINICLESLDFLRDHIWDVQEQGITLHIDEKLPGRTWHFDSNARDKSHHSADCHKKWAARILTIINDTL